MAALQLDDFRKIKLGDYIVIQRQKYTKLHKFGNIESSAQLGKEQIELRNILGQSYDSTFKMSPKEMDLGGGRGSGGGRGGRQKQRLQQLELCSETELRDIRQVLGISSSGEDNRNILDNGDSQQLKSNEIEQLRDECNDSAQIIGKIVENSKTFHTKTEYSQEKYLKKKEKKYFEFVQIRKPTIRLITEIFYRQDPEKVLGIRVDTLSQIISYSGVSAYGNYLLYESGTNGLLPASFLNSMGANTEAYLVHMHPGNVAQKQAILSLNLPDEQLERCISVNIYSVLREFYQGVEGLHEKVLPAGDNEDDKEAEKTEEPSSKKLKIDEEATNVAVAVTVTAAASENEATAEPTSENPPNDEKKPTSTPLPPPQKWQLDNRNACRILCEKFDSLVIAAKEHPSNIVHALLPFVKPSRPVVIYSSCRELLMELYVELKSNTKVTNLHLTSNWLRHYQILPNRTHPEVNMNGNSGFLLCGYTLQ